MASQTQASAAPTILIDIYSNSGSASKQKPLFPKQFKKKKTQANQKKNTFHFQITNRRT